jgi:hypothetical protein
MEPVHGFEAPEAITRSCDAVVQQLFSDLVAEPAGGTRLANLYRGELLGQVEIGDCVEFAIDAEGLARLLAQEQIVSRDARVTLTMERRDFLHRGLINRLEVRLDHPSATLWIDPRDSSGASRYKLNTGYGSVDRSENLVRQTVRDFVRWMALGVFQGAVVFPAERKGLLSTYRLIGNRTAEQSGVLSKASRDFVGLLNDADVQRRSPGGSCRNINRILEESVLSGALEFDPDRESSGLNYTVAGGPTVGIESAASLVRSLAGLYCYFQVSALQQDLVIMDEPEMNAHPEAQLRLMEFFAELVRQDYRVLLTTHSPYLLDHLNNLIALSRIRDGDRGEIPGKYPGSLEPDDVAVYLFTEKGEVIDIFDREEDVIDLQTFSESSDYVSNLYSTILGLQAES